MSAMASQINSLTIVYSTVYSGADQRKHQSSASLAFVWGIHRLPVNSPHKRPVTRKMFPFDGVIMSMLFISFYLSLFDIGDLYGNDSNYVEILNKIKPSLISSDVLYIAKSPVSSEWYAGMTSLAATPISEWLAWNHISARQSLCEIVVITISGITFVLFASDNP